MTGKIVKVYKRLYMDIKPLNAIGDKWTTVTPGRTDDYQKGVNSPRRSWAQAAADAEQNYQDGVSQAAAEGRFGKGVQKAGDSAWKSGALTKGVSRWPQGVRLAGAKYQSGFAPYHSVIASKTLSPRGPKGDPRNYQRVQEIGEALHEAKTGA